MDFKNEAKLKWYNFKNAVGTKVHNAVLWMQQHPVETATGIGVAVTGVSEVRKVLKLHEERVHRDCDYYDNRTGKYTRAKRKLKGWEQDELEARYKRGESYNSILRDMNLRR